jgi:hypothetical protein
VVSVLAAGIRASALPWSTSRESTPPWSFLADTFWVSRQSGPNLVAIGLGIVGLDATMWAVFLAWWIVDDSVRLWSWPTWVAIGVLAGGFALIRYGWTRPSDESGTTVRPEATGHGSGTAIGTVSGGVVNSPSGGSATTSKGDVYIHHHSPSERRPLAAELEVVPAAAGTIERYSGNERLSRVALSRELWGEPDGGPFDFRRNHSKTAARLATTSERVREHLSAARRWSPTTLPDSPLQPQGWVSSE